MSNAWHSVFWSPSKHRWLVRIGAEGRAQRQITVPQDVASGPRAKKAAEEWAEKTINAAPVEDAAPKMLSELAPIAIKLWQDDDRIAPKTRADRISFVRNHILPEFGALPIESIDVPKVRGWIRNMRMRGDARPSIGNRLSALSTLLSDLHAEGHGPDNRSATAKAVRDELPTLKKRAPVSLDAESFETLLNAESVPFWFRLLSALAGLAGLEAGAAFGLEVRDVHSVEDVPIALHVRQSVAILGANGHASIAPTKNAHRGTNEKPRVIPIHPALAALITKWINIEREKWCCAKASKFDLLIPSAAGKPWRPKVADRLRWELRGLGVAVPEGLVFHRLRGCFATWLAAAGVPKDQRQRLMGHAGDVEAEHYEVAGELFETDFEAVTRIAVEVRDGRMVESLGSETYKSANVSCCAPCSRLGFGHRNDVDQQNDSIVSDVAIKKEVHNSLAAGVPKDQRQRLMGHAGDVEGEHYEVVGQLFESDFEAVQKIAVEVRGERRENLASNSFSGTFQEADRSFLRGSTGVQAHAQHEPRIGWECVQRGEKTRKGNSAVCPKLGSRHQKTASNDAKLSARVHRGSEAPLIPAVSFAVPCDDSAAQQVRETLSSLGAPGRNRTCDQRFRNARSLCLPGSGYSFSAADTCSNRLTSSGVATGSGSDFGSAVPNAVQESRDGLRWMLLGFDAAEAMLAGLE